MYKEKREGNIKREEGKREEKKVRKYRKEKKHHGKKSIDKEGKDEEKNIYLYCLCFYLPLTVYISYNNSTIKMIQCEYVCCGHVYLYVFTSKYVFMRGYT